MRKSVLRGTIAAFVFATATAGASQLIPLPLAELPKRADAQVLGRVTQVKPDGDDDAVTVEVASVLRGTAIPGPLTLTLRPRGVKGFDPVLKTGDTGVFFVRSSGKTTWLAYPGAVALFPQSTHFTMPEKPTANAASMQ